MTNLPKPSNLKLWINSDNAVLLNNKVQSLTDLSIYKNNVIQNTVTSQPTVTANMLNGKSSIKFTSSQWMESLTNPILDSDNVTLFVVASNSFMVGRGLDGYGSGWSIISTSNGGISIVESSTNLGLSNNISTENNTISTSIIQQGSSMSNRINGNVAKSIAIYSSFRRSSRNVLLSKCGNDSLFGPGDFYELIMYNTALTATEIIQIETYLAVKYHVTILNYNYALLSKFLIKQYGQYYSINQPLYDTVNKSYSPITLSEGTVPNTSDINAYAFDNINNLLTTNIINGETFKPIDKLYGNFEIKEYKIE